MSGMQIPGVQQLLARSVELPESDSAALDVELLLCEVMQVSRTWLRTWPDRQPTPDQLQRFEAFFCRRQRGEPVAHIVGHRGFWTLELKTDASTLIPRPETELLVEWALQLPLPAQARVLDLGTGSGAIALALASERPDWQITAVDLQPGAVQLAESNRRHNQLDNVQVLQSDWFAAVAGKTFDLMVSNPPYIETDDPHLNEGDVRFEPASALVSGPDGLDDLRLICSAATTHLNRAGWLLVEHGYNQRQAVQQLFVDAGFEQVETVDDLNHLPRITLGCCR